MHNVRQQCVLEGLDRVLRRRLRSRERSRALDGAAEAQLVAIACGEPPEGCARWTLHLLAEELKRRRMDVKSDHVAVTWAEGVRRLVEENFPSAERITLVMDNLNTHAVGREVAAWTSRRNANGPPATWRFTTEDARIKLHSLYPNLTD